jgi:hypothetical protein
VEKDLNDIKQRVTGIEEFMALIDRKLTLIAVSGPSSSKELLTESNSTFQDEIFVFRKKSRVTHSIPTVNGWKKSSENRTKPGYVAEERVTAFVTDAITEISENHLRLAIIEANLELPSVASSYQSNSENMLDEKDYLCGFYSFNKKQGFLFGHKDSSTGRWKVLVLFAQIWPNLNVTEFMGKVKEFFQSQFNEEVDPEPKTLEMFNSNMWGGWNMSECPKVGDISLNRVYCEGFKPMDFSHHLEMLLFLIRVMLAVKDLEGIDEDVAKDLDEIFDKVLVPDKYPVNVAILLAALKLLRNDLLESNVKVTGRKEESTDQSVMSTNSVFMKKAIEEVEEMIRTLDNEGKTYFYLLLKTNMITFYVTHFNYYLNEAFVQEIELQVAKKKRKSSGTQAVKSKKPSST